MLKNFKPTLATVAVALAFATGTVSAEDTKLRIQTHFSPEPLSGQMLSLIHI